LHDLLTSETYIGTLYYGKTERIASANNPDKKTTWRLKPKEEWIPIPVPAIIDQSTFVAAQHQRDRNAQTSRRNRKYEYLLAGHIQCGQCGCKMHGQCDVRYTRRYYRCTRPHYQTETPCRGTISATRLEETIWTAVERVLRNPAFITTEVERRQQGVHAEQSDLERERSLFAGQIAQCEKELRKWEQAYIADVIDVHDLKARKAEVMARRGSLEREMSRLDEQQQLLEQVTLETASLVAYCQRVCRNLQRLDYAEKRLALDALNIRVVWHHNKPLEMHGSIPVAIASDAPCCTPKRAHGRCRRC
jgi:site-specific DNA recombinase